MKAIYLVQGAAALLDKFEPPEGAVVYALCYDSDVSFPWATKSLFDPRCTWAEGRNRLADVAARNHPDFDYLIFADDDVVFLSGSFGDFERAVEASAPALGVPLMDKAVAMRRFDETRPVEPAEVIDEQLIAISHALVGIEGICPLVTRYDHVSWFTPCFIFEYLALSSYGVLQLNTIRVQNEVHRGRTGETLYRQGSWNAAYEAFRSHLNQRGIDYDPAVLPHVTLREEPT